MIKVINMDFSYNYNPYMQNISFEVKKGEIFGFLGPSGAGKSTLQKILIGLLPNYKGNVLVNDIEVKKHNNSFYENIGVDFEFPSLFEKMSAYENLVYFSKMYKNHRLDRIEELLKKVGLYNDKDKKVSDYSKGMKSRLNFIKSIVHDPEIIFLDEPTSGLDPVNSHLMKELIKDEKKKGKTIIITTHNMEDAKELCDRVAFIVDGTIKALDTPHNLIMKKGAAKVKFSYLNEDKEEVVRLLELNNLYKDKEFNDALNNNSILTIHSTEPNLGDIFMDITGRVLS